ncbi:uncharacterized protein VICG_01721 [Vittaforma corneae ATCC 50505]|uniref:Uncharacterized protein n=1 Tax=Vittaforma corneae (strain ATCC 50505) TaxID=993615 RepID=L2GLS1_VITCO|nr:uncharacterized protein VICG_01721 [Vittaforma corneae ATCC 50505]ELA41232.1 hypothetical protein VICG_01721 [Vittaforma corneae ATCC 50505]
MLAHVFRPPEFIPSPVTSLCSNNRIVAIFRRNGMLELHHSSSLQKFLFFEISEEIVQSAFLDLNTVICLSKTGRVVIFDTSNLNRTVLDLDATNISVECQKIGYAPRSFYFSNSRNEVFHYQGNINNISNNSVGDSIVQIATVTSKISSLLAAFSYILIGTSDGWITILHNSKVITEIEIKTTPIKFAGINVSSFCVCGENGHIYLINPISEIVLDKFHVREHPLNDLVILNDQVHVSGVDSRIFCAKILKNKIVKAFQGDPHSAEVLCMCVDNGRVLSGGEDCTVVISSTEIDKYTFRILYDSSVLAGRTKEYFYTAYSASLDLFSISNDKDTHTPLDSDVVNCDGNVDASNLFNDSANKLITFRIDESVLENINQKTTKFNHFLSIKQKNHIISADIHFDQQYACISTSKKAILYSLFTGSKLHIENLREFPPAKWVRFSSGFLALQHFDFTVTVLNIDSFEEHHMKYEDINEKVEISNNYLVFPVKGEIYNLRTHEMHPISIGTPVVSQCFNDHIVYLVESPDGYSKKVIKDHQCIAEEPISLPLVNNQNSTLFKDILYMAGDNAFSNEKYIFLLRNGAISTYEIGLLIHNIALYKDSIVIIQSSYKTLSKTFKKSVFKEKFSNK